MYTEGTTEQNDQSHNFVQCSLRSLGGDNNALKPTVCYVKWYSLHWWWWWWRTN